MVSFTCFFFGASLWISLPDNPSVSHNVASFSRIMDLGTSLNLVGEGIALTVPNPDGLTPQTFAFACDKMAHDGSIHMWEDVE